MIEGGTWKSARGEVRDLVRGVLFEQASAGEDEDGVIAQRGNLVHSKQLKVILSPSRTRILYYVCSVRGRAITDVERG